MLNRQQNAHRGTPMQSLAKDTAISLTSRKALATLYVIPGDLDYFVVARENRFIGVVCETHLLHSEIPFQHQVILSESFERLGDAIDFVTVQYRIDTFEP
jgi:hypothetical protein